MNDVLILILAAVVFFGVTVPSGYLYYFKPAGKHPEEEES